MLEYINVRSLLIDHFELGKLFSAPMASLNGSLTTQPQESTLASPAPAQQGSAYQ